MEGSMLQREVKAVMGQLSALLSASVSLFYSPCSKYSLRSRDNGSILNAIRGSVILHEDTLCSMEVLIKPSKTTALIKSTFREDKQWKLQQIQDAINHLKMAANMLSIFSDTLQKQSYSRGYVSDLLEIAIRSINMCRMRLFSPCKLSLEALVTSGIVKMFTPSLPGDTIINFFILEDSLVVNHYTVQQMHTAISKTLQVPNTPRLFHPVGSILEHAGSQYEVISAHKADCPIPWLSKVLLATDICLQLANELHEKLGHT